VSCVHFGGYVSADASPPLPFNSPKRSDSKVYRLQKMSMSPHVNIRIAAAGNPMTDAETLYFLSSDPERGVRAWVLRNPSVTRALLMYRSLCETDETLLSFIRYRLDR
jgi:hypothetical protein